MIFNPWMILGIVLFVAATALTSFRAGMKYERADHLAETITEQKLAEKIRSDIRAEGDKISSTLEDRIGKIKVENKTVVQRIQREREVHHVLTSPDCAFPASTVKVLNDARAGQESRTGSARTNTPSANPSSAGDKQ